MLDTICDALACYRITRLIVSDTLLDEPRMAVTRWTDRRAPKLSELIECPWCTSPYIAAGVLVARKVAPRAWGTVARLLAFSAVAGLLSGHEYERG